MTLPTKTLAAALVAAAIPLCGGSAAAAPLSQSLALNNADVGTIEQVQYRRWNRGRWIGPAAAGLAAGAIVGGALSSQYNDGYYAYGAAAPSGYYAYGAAPRYVGPGYRDWDSNLRERVVSDRSAGLGVDARRIAKTPVAIRAGCAGKPAQGGPEARGAPVAPFALRMCGPWNARPRSWLSSQATAVASARPVRP